MYSQCQHTSGTPNAAHKGGGLHAQPDQATLLTAKGFAWVAEKNVCSNILSILHILRIV